RIGTAAWRGGGGVVEPATMAVNVDAADAALPTTTAPEALRLTWGADPTSEMTVSWGAPGTAAIPAPTLVSSKQPITAANPGVPVFLPDAAPLDLTKGPRSAPCVT